MVRAMTNETHGPPGKNPGASDDGVPFGFEDVPEAEKGPRVRRVFESVADRYDLMNDLMSGGIHRLWKQAMIDWLVPRPGMSLLDVAGGTGDIAFRVVERVGAEQVGPIVVCDLTPQMLSVGRDRAIDHGWLLGRATPVHWIAGAAEALPLAERSVEAYTIAFGLRNVTRIDAALAEARRVLKPGGRFLCLEFSQVVMPLLSQLYDLYSFKVLPAVGAVVTGDRDAYRYLPSSLEGFPTAEALEQLLREAGVAEHETLKLLSEGVVA
jgi:demethylmenaquinone methyltransferase/2-methoxy-6-polyprenyl-1,4-benzoquinol methylase